MSRRSLQIGGGGGGGGGSTAPTRIFAAAFTHNWVADGDSITAANSGLDYPTYALQVLSGLNGPWQCQNVAVIGERVDEMLANAVSVVDSKYDATKTANVYSVMGGTNDLSFGRTIAAIWADLQTLCQGRRTKGYKVVIGTILTRDFLASSHTVLQSDVDALNALIRAGWSGCADALCDFAAIPYFGPFPLSDDRFVYQSDQLHPIATIPRRMLGDLIAPIIVGLAPYGAGAPLIANVFTIGGGKLVASSGGTDVYLSGANLNGATCTENGVAVSLTTVTANHVKYTTAAHSGTSAALQLSVTNNGKTSAPSYATVQYTAPAVTAVAPTTVFTGGSAITVTGTCFGTSCAVYLGTVDGAHQCTGVSNNATHPEQTVAATTPAALGVGTYGVIVVNSDGQQSGAATTLVLASPAAPTITSVDTENATTAGSIPVTVLTGGAGGAGGRSNKHVITGTNMTGTTQVDYKNGAVTITATVASGAVVIDSSTQLTVTPPDASALLTTAGGMCTATVTNASGPSTAFANALCYLPSGAIWGHLANRGVSLNSGNVSTLLDFVGTADALQTTAAQQPLFVASSISSKPAWRVAGGSPIKAFAPIPTTATYTGSAMTFVAWVKRISTPGNSQVLAAWATGDTGAGVTSLGFKVYDVPGSDIRIYRNSGFKSQLNTPLVNATPAAVSARFDATNCFVRENGVDGTTVASTGAFGVNFFNYGIGWNISAPGEPETSMDIAGGIAFNRALVAGDFTTLSAWSSANFGITNT